MDMMVDRDNSCLFSGRIEQILMNEETKSEGVYTYLVVKEEGESECRYRLFRDGVVEFNDSYFDEFVDCDVIVDGDLIAGSNWLKVLRIDLKKVDYDDQEVANISQLEEI